jgi:hypothetical protein
MKLIGCEDSNVASIDLDLITSISKLKTTETYDVDNENDNIITFTKEIKCKIEFISYDILDELFIQLIYQLPLLKRDKCKNDIRLANCNWKMADEYLIDRIYVLLEENNIDATKSMNHYFSMWFSRYINVNYNKLSIYVYYYDIGDPINILSCHDKLIFKRIYIIIYIIFI